MKKSLLVFGIFSFLLFSQDILLSSDGKYGIGFVLGSPTGITGKVYLTRESAFDVGIGEIYEHGYYVWGDYLKHFYGVFPVANLPVYVGVGAAFHDYEKDNKKDHEDDDENRLEIRMPFGMEYLTQKIPLGIFLEIVPTLRLIPDFDVDIRAGLGLRYYF